MAADQIHPVRPIHIQYGVTSIHTVPEYLKVFFSYVDIRTEADIITEYMGMYSVPTCRYCMYCIRGSGVGATPEKKHAPPIRHLLIV